MAFEVKKINPLDLQPRKAIGVNLPFTGKAVFNSTYETKDALKANMINYFLTGKGEKYFEPTFGSELRFVVFDNLNTDTEDRIETIIKEGLYLYFPEVILTELNINSDTDNNTVTIFLKYAVSETNIEDELIINFQQ